MLAILLIRATDWMGTQCILHFDGLAQFCWQLLETPGQIELPVFVGELLACLQAVYVLIVGSRVGRIKLGEVRPDAFHCCRRVFPALSLDDCQNMGYQFWQSVTVGQSLASSLPVECMP